MYAYARIIIYHYMDTYHYTADLCNVHKEAAPKLYKTPKMKKIAGRYCKPRAGVVKYMCRWTARDNKKAAATEGIKNDQNQQHQNRPRRASCR